MVMTKKEFQTLSKAEETRMLLCCFGDFKGLSEGAKPVTMQPGNSSCTPCLASNASFLGSYCVNLPMRSEFLVAPQIIPVVFADTDHATAVVGTLTYCGHIRWTQTG